MVDSEGQVLRARTGMAVNSAEDQVIPVGYETETGEMALACMRAGAPYGGKDGEERSIAGMMRERGFHLRSDGRFVNGEGRVVTAWWEWGEPDRALLARR